MSRSVRAPAVAGRFYPKDPGQLRDAVAGYLAGPESAKAPALGAVVPHAGYMFSGAVAGRTFRPLSLPGTIVVLCPNHTGMGPPISVWEEGAFQVPGAEVTTDEALARALLTEVGGAQADMSAHVREHAIEVELPFLLALRPDVTIVPIVLGSLSLEQSISLGQGIARVGAGRDLLVVASSDMSHYVPDATARALDHLALEKILDLDGPGLLSTVVENDISMCGVLPAIAMLAYARAQGAAAGSLAAYATSGETSGDFSQVVGYAGVIVR